MNKIAYIGCLGLVSIITTEFGIIGILPQVAAHYGISIDRAGILLSAFALVIALTGPFMTLLAARFDRRNVMALSIGIFLLAGMVSLLSPPFWLLLLVRVLPAFLQPVFISTAIAVAVSNAGKGEAHRLMAVVLGGISLATVTTLPVATWLAGVYGWQASFGLQALMSGIALVAILWLLPPMPVTVRKSYGAQLRVLTQPNFLLSAVMNFLMIGAWFCSYSYFADYLGKVKHMDTAMISSMMLLFGITGVLGNRLAGKMLGKSVAGTTAFFLAGTLLLPVGLYYAGDNQLLTIFMIGLWGLFYAPCFLTASAYIIAAAPEALEFANSFSTSCGNLGVSVGTAVSGMVIASYGVQYTPWTGMVFGGAALLVMYWRSRLRPAAAKVPCMAQ
ncbi:MFS transporter [Chitinophaga nivalis]|uniref:MFS transporter n=1 Tax=Chitinophaga nivalis TaxID=2991709 RepID=A0ABT3IFC2_9BACT|nr:MFS transporter [Chitinophaga nivalis]MCW3467655.1 MFS transporter [Chitinophaga nivalis]MCW3482653.1 MFS transporter [Chitinophaga nivalis]